MVNKMNTEQQELFQAIKDNRLYDYIASHARDYSKDDLLRILLEVLFVTRDELDRSSVRQCLYEELLDWFE